MKHLFIPYELAVKLKELGFKEDCFGYYGYSKKLHINSNYKDAYNLKELVIAPLYQQVVDWLEANYGFFFERLMNEDNGVYYIVWNGTVSYSELKTIDKAIEESFSFITHISNNED